jgi:hypothetical protein
MLILQSDCLVIILGQVNPCNFVALLLSAWYETIIARAFRHFERAGASRGMTLESDPQHSSRDNFKTSTVCSLHRFALRVEQLWLWLLWL